MGRIFNIDETTYRELFYELYPRLVSYSIKLVKDGFEAEEVVGNVMLQLWESRRRFENVRDIKSYLYTMVRNASLAHLKKDKPMLPLDELPIQDDAAAGSFDFDLLEEEVYAVLQKALNELPMKCREVFELSCIDGLTYREVAEELGISVNTVKSQRARAIELLRLQMKDYPYLLLLLLSLLSIS